MTSLTVLRRERNRIHRTAYSRIVKTQGHSEQLGATQKPGAPGNIQQASRLASAPVCAVPTAHRRPDCCPRPDRSTSSSPGVVLWVTMVDLGLFFRQFKVEVPRAHWSGGRAAGMCGCVEPSSGILVSGGRRAHQFPFSWRHIHHALPNNSSKDRQSFSDGHSLRCVQLPGPLTLPGRETACVPKTSILGCRPTAPQPYRVPIASRRGINQVRQKTRRKPA